MQDNETVRRGTWPKLHKVNDRINAILLKGKAPPEELKDQCVQLMNVLARHPFRKKEISG